MGRCARSLTHTCHSTTCESARQISKICFWSSPARNCARDQTTAGRVDARNLEFVRDRRTLIFALLMPIALVVGMSFIFGGKERPFFKVGVIATVIDKQAH